MLRLMRNHTKIIMTIVILFFIASCFAGYGLYVRGNRGGGEGMRDYAVAEVGGKTVMRSELEKAAQQISERYGSNVTSADAPGIRKAALDGIAIEGELAKEISDRKIEAADDEIDAEYKRAMDSYPTREEFAEYLKRSGRTERQIKEDIRKNIQMRKLFESLENDIKIDDKETRAFYDATKPFLFKRPSGFNVNIAAFTDKAAAEEARKEIAAGGKWDDVIAKHRAALEMATSYDKPMLMAEQMLQNELAVLKDYPMNKVTPVEDAGANRSYIAIKRSKEAERVLSFDEASVDAASALKNQKMQQAQQKLFGDLLERADVKILDESIFPSNRAEGSAASADKVD